MAASSSRAHTLAYIALFLALSVLLPIAFHAADLGGRIFLPMHIPALLAGFLVGPGSGLVVGLLGPGLSNMLTGMPPAVMTPAMTLELSFYGLIAGITYVKMRMNIVAALLIAMVAGRLMFGLAIFLLGLFIDMPYDAALYFSSAGPILTGLPGIAVQLFLIPILVAGVNRYRRSRRQFGNITPR